MILYLPESHYEFQTKAQTLDNIHKQKIHFVGEFLLVILLIKK